MWPGVFRTQEVLKDCCRQAAIEEGASGSAPSTDCLVGRFLTSLLTDLSPTRHAEAILVAKNMRLAL